MLKRIKEVKTRCGAGRLFGVVLTKLSLLLLTAACNYALAPASAAEQERYRVAIFADRGACPEAFEKEFSQSRRMKFETVDADDIRNGILEKFDALVVPGGAARREARSMGLEAREEVRRFVSAGGIYMGVCAGAYLASSARDVYLNLIPLRTLDQEHWYRTDSMASVEVELTPAGMEVFGIDRSKIMIGYENGPIFAPPPELSSNSLTPLGFFRSEVVGDGGQRGVMIGAPALVLARYGRGAVLVISPHPEETPALKTTELHALNWLFDHRHEQFALAHAVPEPPPPEQKVLQSSGDTASPSFLNREAIGLAERIFKQADAVQYMHREVPASRQVTKGDDGSFKVRTDSSGFISFIVHTIASRHYEAVRVTEPTASYPQAAAWLRFFASLSAGKPQEGWCGISNWRELKPGDYMAWSEKDSQAAQDAGHLMLVSGLPGKVQLKDGCRFVEIPVIDCSTIDHFPPQDLPPQARQTHRDGLGIGCARLILSQDDKPVGYWEGRYLDEGHTRITGPTFSDLIRFARMVPFHDD